jgi:hypothetical protein
VRGILEVVWLQLKDYWNGSDQPYRPARPWLWHAMFDGTPLCRCPRSRQMKDRRGPDSQ